MLKAITLFEPFATLMAYGIKTNETRGQRTHHRGDICIHAGQNRSGASNEVCEAAFTAFKRRGKIPVLNFGKIVAVVELYEVYPSEKFFRSIMYSRSEYNELTAIGRIGLCEEEFEFGNYSSVRFVYLTRALRRLREPVACQGFQSVGWTLPAEVEAAVRRQL